MIRTANGMSGAVVRGIDPDSAMSLIKGFTATELSQRLMPDEDKAKLPGIILGIELAKNIGAAEGDTLVLMSPSGMISPVGHIPALKRFVVTGIFESGMYEYDGSLAYIHMLSAQKLMGINDRVSAVGVWVEDIFQADTIKKRYYCRPGTFFLWKGLDGNK